MNEDSNSVWLIVRSNNGLQSDEIADRIGLSSNARVKNHPHGGNNFFLKSDISVKDTKPLVDHIDWMASACSPNFVNLHDFLNETGNSGELFLYVFTDHDAGYVELPAGKLKGFVNCGLNLSVKIETN
jgi:hypothetical protein